MPAVVPGDVAGGNRATELHVSRGHRRIAHITVRGGWSFPATRFAVIARPCHT